MALGAAPAQAQVADAFTFKNLTHFQINDSTVVDTGAFFNAGLDSMHAGDFATVTMNYPGPASPDGLPQNSPTNFGEGPSFSDQASMDAAYPFGDYAISASGGTAPNQIITLHYTADAYTGDLPFLAGPSFDALQGLKTSQSSLALAFDSFTPDPSATSAFTFFTIFGSQTCGFLSPSATGCSIDPRKLAPGTTYTWELDFSDRVESFPNGTLTGVNFDVRTDGTFTTATPEPASWAMMLLGFGALGAAMRSRRRIAAA
jgi:hypothetical protein